MRNVLVVVVVLIAAFVFTHGGPERACKPYPVPVAGWKLPFSVTIGDSVVAWKPNQYAAQKEAVQVAYRNPKDTIRVASITELVWERRDGSPCESSWRPENEDTPQGGVEWSANR